MGIALAVVVIIATFVASYGDVPKDFVVNSVDNHAYKVMYQSQTWTDARNTCAKMGAKLAVPKSREEFKFLQGVIAKMKYANIVDTKFKFLVWLGISNLDDYQVWRNVDDENIENTGFHTWASAQNGHISPNPAEPHCAVMDAANFGLRDWWCHRRQPYICEMLIQNAISSKPI